MIQRFGAVFRSLIVFEVRTSLDEAGGVPFIYDILHHWLLISNMVYFPSLSFSFIQY